MNVVGLELEQGGVDVLRHATPPAEIEAHRVLGRRGGDVQPPGAEYSGLCHRLVEECASHARSAMSPADMKKLELELIFLSPDETALEHHYANQDPAIESADKRAAVIEAIEQDRTVAIRLARWPALHVVVFRLQNEFVALAVVDPIDHLGTIDRPDVADLMPLELPDLHLESSPPQPIPPCPTLQRERGDT
jgi:hypothetical protein